MPRYKMFTTCHNSSLRYLFFQKIMALMQMFRNCFKRQLKTLKDHANKISLFMLSVILLVKLAYLDNISDILSVIAEECLFHWLKTDNVYVNEMEILILLKFLWYVIYGTLIIMKEGHLLMDQITHTVRYSASMPEQTAWNDNAKRKSGCWWST